MALTVVASFLLLLEVALKTQSTYQHFSWTLHQKGLVKIGHNEKVSESRGKRQRGVFSVS